MMLKLRALSIALLSLPLLSCGGDKPGGGNEEHVLKVEKWTPSGDLQTDTVGQLLTKVLRVKVTLDGAVTAGVTVSFSGGALGTPSMVTGTNGIATSNWTLDVNAGEQSVTATVDGAVGSPLTFTAIGVPGPATNLVMATGDGQAADTSQTFAAFGVRVVDAWDNGIVGRWVHWSKSGPLTFVTDSIITDVNGASNMFATAGTTSGPISVTATVAGLAGSPITFNGAVVANPTVVNVSSNFYSPDSINIAAGSAVKWHWVNSGHSVASTGSPSFASSDILNAGDNYGPILFDTPGVYRYECAVHGAAMQGVVVVN